MSDSDPLSQLSPDQQREMLQKLLQRKVATSKQFPMSAGQQGLWHAYRRDPCSTAFNVFLPSRVRSKLDVDALRETIDYLVQRHACLRTTFSDRDRQFRQQVNDRLPPEFLVIDARELSEQEVRQRVITETQRPFDLEAGPLLRLVVFHKSPNDYVIVATTHHIVVDFWSLILILSELRLAYPSFLDGRRPNLPAAKQNYLAFVQMQQRMLEGPQGERHWEHWKEYLAGAPTVLEWATDFRRPPRFTGHADVAPFSFSPDTASKVNKLASVAKTTPTSVVLAALQVFISRSTNREEFLIGSPFSGRGQQEFEQTVGFFVNMLPLRANLSDNPTFLSLIRRVSHAVITAMAHESFPFAHIVRRVKPPRDPSRSPLFQVSCTFEKAHIREESGRAGFLLPSQQEFADFGGLQQESYEIPHPTCHYDVEFIFEQTDNDLRGMICYCKDLFTPETAASMATNFERLMTSLLDDPHRDVRSAAWWGDVADKQATVGDDWQTVLELIDVSSSDIATIGDGDANTHAALRQAARHIAAGLVQRGIVNGDFVPVAGRFGAGIMPALLGVLYAGAVVIPIDTDQPAVGLSELIEDTDAKLLIVDQRTDWSGDSIVPLVVIDELRNSSDASISLPDISPNDLAYVIYTSGSTGRPNGVMVSHGAIANTLQWRRKDVKLATVDRVLMLLSHQFDAGFGVTLSVLSQGASVVWADRGSRHDVDRIITQIVRDKITVLPAVPSLLRLIVTHPRFRECRGLRQIWSGGESMPADLPEWIWQHCSARIWNFYGPTEAAMEATAHEVQDQDPRRPVSIGKAIAHTEAIILDSTLTPVPATVPGQLAIRGRGLARGYLNRPDLTAEKFISLPRDAAGNSLVYLTGDLCRRRVNGEIDFLGRIDNQVKVRGYRIELEEIDAAIRSHPDVENAAVKLIGDDPATARLAAFVTCRKAIRDDDFLNSLKQHASEVLPPYKRPAVWEVLSRLPIGSSGKVNRHLLPNSIQRGGDADEYVAPSTPLESHLAKAWGEMLGIEKVGVNQDFFQLGGSSLQAAMMTAKLSDDLNVHVPTALLFDLADIAKLAQRLVQLHEIELARRFGMKSVTAYSQSGMTRVPLATADTSSAKAATHPLLAPLKPDGDRIPIFMVHPPGGIVVCYRELAEQLHPAQPLIAIRSRGLHGREQLPESLEAMAADYINAMRRLQANGPYIVGGWSLGGLIAYEICQQLVRAGDAVKRLVLLDSSIPEGSTDLVDDVDQSNVGLEYGLDLSLHELSALEVDQQLPFLWQHAINLGVLSDDTPKEVVNQVLQDMKFLFHHHVELTSHYRIEPLDAPVLLVRPNDVPVELPTSKDRGWGRLSTDVQVRYVTGHHHSMVQMPQVVELAKLLNEL